MGKSTKVSEIEVINQSIGRSMVAPITGKPAPTRPIVKTRSLEQIGKLSSMILWYVNLRNAPLGGQKSFTLNHHLSAVDLYVWTNLHHLSPQDL